ncbi:MAG: ABC transporter ATP-binding protein [Deltaproteobacteria bacterium]|nr:MAG: ABC transporter ATP-binding protein [Deltaproteobacteria bacterium]
MSGLTLENIDKNFGSVVAVRDVNLNLPTGQFICFLGPSGCGKTTLLRLIAGLETPTRGRILLDEEDITHAPAHKRNFGVVFQSLALFPHLTVGENIAYSLRVRKVDKDTRQQKTAELLDLVQLSGFMDRHISQLSGGQRQRVATARALAIEPRLFLLDEPLSALDAKLREDMQLELRMLQQRLAVTTILVTHDQREAMTMSDLVVVMGPDNRVHQMGFPLDIYRNPADTFVADFIGTSNLLDGTYTGNREVMVSGTCLEVPEVPEGVPLDTKVTVSIRPEEVHVLPGIEKGDNRLHGQVSFVRDVGSSVEIYLDCSGLQIVSQSTPKERPEVKQGDQATAVLPPTACIVLRS